MKCFSISLLIFLLLFFSCDDAKKIFNIHETPVIDEIILHPDNGRLYPQDTLYAEVVASNPEEGGLNYLWSVTPSAGQFIGAADQAFAYWVAPFADGDYQIKVEVSNGYKNAESKRTITVVAVDDPLVNISAPAAGGHFVQHEPIEITGTVFQGNGIKKISLLVNGNLIRERMDISNGPFTFQFTPDSSYLGQATIRVEAEAQIVSNTGSAQVAVTIEGFLPKIPSLP